MMNKLLVVEAEIRRQRSFGLPSVCVLIKVHLLVLTLRHSRSNFLSCAASSDFIPPSPPSPPYRLRLFILGRFSKVDELVGCTLEISAVLDSRRVAVLDFPVEHAHPLEVSVSQTAGQFIFRRVVVRRRLL